MSATFKQFERFCSLWEGLQLLYTLEERRWEVDGGVCQVM
jgi:hypothetical protein